MATAQDVTKTALDDLLVNGGREALLQCERIPLTSPLFAEARWREERRQERLANEHAADSGGEPVTDRYWLEAKPMFPGLGVQHPLLRSA